nr:SGNH hydrolase domain-containing protein [Ferrimonas balearica]
MAVRYQDVDGRLPQQVEYVANEALNISPNKSVCHAGSGIESPGCMYGGEKVAAIVIGDSHADATITAVQAAISDPQYGALGWTYSGCRTILGSKRTFPKSGDHCDRFNEWALQESDTLDSSIPLIIINRTSSGAFGEPFDEKMKNRPQIYFSTPVDKPTPEFLDEFRERMISTACIWAEKRPVYMVRPLPEMSFNVPKVMSRSLMFGSDVDGLSVSLDDYRRYHAFVWEAQDEAAKRCGVKLLDPTPYLCSEGRCWASKDGRPLYYDDDHLSEYGNKLLVPMFKAVFEPQQRVAEGNSTEL